MAITRPRKTLSTAAGHAGQPGSLSSQDDTLVDGWTGAGARAGHRDGMCSRLSRNQEKSYDSDCSVIHPSFSSVARIARPLGQSTNTSCTATTNNTISNNTSSTFSPTSNWTSMTSPFGAAKDDVAFELFCGHDLQTGDSNDLLCVWVYRFADCINACESFNNPARDHTNATCTGVSYHLDDLNVRMANCWLKAFQKISKVANVNVSSAVITTN